MTLVGQRKDQMKEREREPDSDKRKRLPGAFSPRLHRGKEVICIAGHTQNPLLFCKKVVSELISLCPPHSR